MEMRKTLLEKCEEVIDSMPWPFGKQNLTTEKIFNDLIQFHSEQHSGGVGGLNQSIVQDDSVVGSKSGLQKGS